LKLKCFYFLSQKPVINKIVHLQRKTDRLLDLAPLITGSGDLPVFLGIQVPASAALGSRRMRKAAQINPI
jgi:hypothetical protein